MPRVLLVSHAMPPHLGGIEFVVEEEADALCRLGLCVNVVTSSWGQPNDQPSKWSKQTVPALNLFERRFGVPFPVFGPSLITTLISAVRRADVVHIHDVFYISSLAAGVTALILDRPVVLTQHVDLIPHPSRLVKAAQRTVYRTYGRFLFSLSARVLVLNDRVQEFVAEGGAAPERIEFLPNGVDVEAYRPALKGEAAQQRISLGLPLERVLVLFAGRPVSKKGFDLLADCASPEFDLIFVGGEQRPMEFARNGGRSYFLGSVPRVRMRDIYRAVDVFCLPSMGEGFPLTVQEAMASGLPVITTNDEAYRRYQVPTEAICFVRRNQVELESALNRLANDAALRVQIGQRAREYVLANFSWEAHAQRLVQIYQDVQKDHEAGSRRHVLISSRRKSRK